MCMDSHKSNFCMLRVCIIIIISIIVFFILACNKDGDIKMISMHIHAGSTTLFVEVCTLSEEDCKENAKQDN